MAGLTRSGLRGDVNVLWLSGSSVSTGELLCAEVARLVGVPAVEVRLSHACPHCGSSSHGRPVVLHHDDIEMPFVSMSRVDGAQLLAVSDAGPVGVDVERLDAVRFAGFGDVALHQRESAPTVEARAVTWVRKESLLKATGDALHLDPRLIRLSDPHQPPELLEWSAPRPPVSRVWLEDLDIEGHAACVAVLSTDPPRVIVRRAVPEVLLR